MAKKKFNIVEIVDKLFNIAADRKMKSLLNVCA